MEAVGGIVTDRARWAIDKVMSGHALTPEDCASLSIKEAIAVAQVLSEISRNIRAGAANGR